MGKCRSDNRVNNTAMLVNITVIAMRHLTRRFLNIFYFLFSFFVASSHSLPAHRLLISGDTCILTCVADFIS